MAVLPELVLYYVGITSAVKVGGHFDAYVERLKWIYIFNKLLNFFLYLVLLHIDFCSIFAKIFLFLLTTPIVKKGFYSL